MGWGGRRPGAGRPRAADRVVKAARPAGRTIIAAAPRQMALPMKLDSPQGLLAMAQAAESIRNMGEQRRAERRSPFKLPDFPPSVVPSNKQMAMDDALGAMPWGEQQLGNWAATALDLTSMEGLAFPGYAYLANLSQRPEYRIFAETIATEMTRKFVKLRAVGDDDKNDRIDALSHAMDDFGVRDKFGALALNDNFFGRSHLFFDLGVPLGVGEEEMATSIGGGRDSISKGKVAKGSLKGIRVVEPVWVSPTFYNVLNPLEANYYKPEIWQVQGRAVHASRLLSFVGRPVPDILKPAYAFGGLSMTQMAQPYVDIWLKTRSSVGEIIHAFSVMVLKTDLATIMAPGGASSLFARADLFNAVRDNAGLMMLNKETEDFSNVSASIAGLSDLQAQAQEHMAAVARIPLVKLFGISPKGLNASAEGEIRVFYDTIASMQNTFMRPGLQTTLDFLMLHLWGEVDDGITFDFVPLWETSEKERADLRKADAETDTIRIDQGVISPEEVRSKIAADPESPFHGLDPDDMPEPPEEPVPLGPDDDPETPPNGNGEGEEDERPLAGDDAAFEEAKHPRAPDGKFGSGSGGGSSGKETSAEAGNGTGTGGAASGLYTASTKTADQVVAGFKGGTEAIKATRARLDGVTNTDATVEKGGFKNTDGTYTAERAALHRKIIDEMFSPETVARATPAAGERPVLTVLGGRGGSGKSWLTKAGVGPVDGSKALLLDADHMKEQLPEYQGWNAAQVHEESSHLLGMADERAKQLGLNTIHDSTMKSLQATEARIKAYTDAGYELEGYYMYASPETAAERAMSRYSKGGTFSGRFVPPEIVLANTDNENNFDKLSAGMRRWGVYDNNTTGAKEPKLVKKSD